MSKRGLSDATIEGLVDLKPKRKITLDLVTSISRPPQQPGYSPYGYLIAADGTTYTLLHKWWHGAVLALLYPDEAKRAGYELPDYPSDLDVFEFQRFELDNHNMFPVIRICPERMMSAASIDRGGHPATDEQIEAVRLVFNVVGLDDNSEIVTDGGDMQVGLMWEYLTDDLDVWSNDKRRDVQTSLIKKEGL